MQVGVFYRVFHNPPRKTGTNRVLNFEIPDDTDPETYPVVVKAREKLAFLHPEAKHFTIVATSRNGPIEIDGEPHVQP